MTARAHVHELLDDVPEDLLAAVERLLDELLDEVQGRPGGDPFLEMLLTGYLQEKECRQAAELSAAGPEWEGGVPPLSS